MAKSAKTEFREYLHQLLTSFSGGNTVFVDEQIRTIVRLAKKAYENNDDFEPLPEDVNAVYGAYPTRCVVSGRTLGKSTANKEKIGRMLKDNTAEYLIKTIQRYVEDCKRDKVWMQNFKTFLNNPPDFDFTEKPKTVDIGGYRDLRKITEAQ